MNTASLFYCVEIAISGFVSVLFGIRAFSPEDFLFYSHTVSYFPMGGVEEIAQAYLLRSDVG